MRKRKFDIKLRFSQQNGFPYHIVSSEEFKFFGDEIELTVVDGIIGSVIESLQESIFWSVFHLSWKKYAEEIDSQPSWYKSEFVQDLITGLEVDCDAEHNKLFRKTGEVRGQVHSITGTPSYPHGYRTFEEPECPNVDWPPWDNLEAFERRAQALKKGDVWGCVVTISDTLVGEVSEIVKVRNVAHSLSLVIEIGELMAWSKLLRLLRRRL